MNLENKILSLRKKAGLSQEEMAEKLNVSRQTISRWEVGTALPDAENLRQLSSLFVVTTDYLLNDEYESDSDIPPVKIAEESLSDKTKKFQKFLLIAAIAFGIATIGYLFIAIDRLNIGFALLAVMNAILSGVYLFRYENDKIANS